MLDIFIILDIVPVGPLDRQDFWLIAQQIFRFFRGVVLGQQGQRFDRFRFTVFHAKAKGQLAVIEFLFFL